MNSRRPNLRGAILAGGLSRRFGSDKALAEFGGRPLLECLMATLASVVADPVVIVNDPGRYAGSSRKRLADVIPGCGPLGGIYTALTRLHADAVLVLTCDMPLVTAGLLRELVGAWRPGDAAVVADAGFVTEPFPGIYDASLTRSMESFLQEGRLSVRHFLAAQRGVRTIRAAKHAHDFFNMNTPEDFAALQRQDKEDLCPCQDRWNSY